MNDVPEEPTFKDIVKSDLKNPEGTGLKSYQVWTEDYIGDGKKSDRLDAIHEQVSVMLNESGLGLVFTLALYLLESCIQLAEDDRERLLLFTGVRHWLTSAFSMKIGERYENCAHDILEQRHEHVEQEIKEALINFMFKQQGRNN